MKTLLILISAMVVFFSGCSQTQPKFKAIDECIIDDTTAPKWVCGISPMSLDMYTAASSSEITTNESFARKIATAKARAELTQVLNTHVSDTVSINENSELSNNSVKSTLSTDQDLKLADTLAYWKHPTNKRVYILVGIKK